MENTENKAKTTENKAKSAELVTYNVTGIISVDAFDKDPQAAVKLLAERTALLNDNERANIVKGGEYAGRLAWVITAINVAQACNAVKRTEQATKKEQLADMLSMKKSSIYNYLKAGNKLLAYKYDKIPLSMYEFIKDEPTKKPEVSKVTLTKLIGLYKMTDGETEYKYNIYTAVKTLSDGKTVNTAVDVPEKSKAFDGAEISVQVVQGKEIYVLNGKEIDVHFLSIRK